MIATIGPGMSHLVLGKKPMNLSVVVVNRNTRAMLRDCLRSLTENGPSWPFEIWVVDNASDDASVQMVRSEFPEVRLIANQDNVGFARANNQALAQAKGRYCLLLNPDTIVPAGALDSMVQFMEDTPNAGVVGCAQVYPDGRRQRTCHRAITLTREAFVAFGLARVFPGLIDYELRAGDITSPRHVDWVEGGALLARRSVLATVGMMDEAFFMYVEDADLCFRIWRANSAVYYLPDIQIVHYRGQSTGFEQRAQRALRLDEKSLLMLHRSKAYFIRKQYGDRQGKVYSVVARFYGLRKLGMGLTLYALRKMDHDTWNSFAKACKALIKADL